MSMKADSAEALIAPGFRFHPTDEELLSFYLRRKMRGKMDVISELDIHKFDPWELPRTEGENQCFFFCRRDLKYKNSKRPNRVTPGGFWKATGRDRRVYAANDRATCIGLKKSLVFYRGRAARAVKSDWMLHELRFADEEDSCCWTVCRIFKKRTPDASRHKDCATNSAASEPEGKPSVNTWSSVKEVEEILESLGSPITFSWEKL